jgi:hypothetical protein
MNDDRSHSSLLVPPSTQDWMQGVLSAKVVLVMYGDYQCSKSADVYKLIKGIKRELSASFGKDYLVVPEKLKNTSKIRHFRRKTSVKNCQKLLRLLQNL